MKRLGTLSPDLLAKLERASRAKQKAACLVACELAISNSRFSHPDARRSLDQLRSKGAIGTSLKAKLDRLVGELDGEYFRLQKASEEGRAGANDYLIPFRQARAVAALSFAGTVDVFEGAAEAIYEASATTEDKDRFTSLIGSVLDQ